jgi:hypothetical protein
MVGTKFYLHELLPPQSFLCPKKGLIADKVLLSNHIWQYLLIKENAVNRYQAEDFSCVS